MARVRVRVRVREVPRIGQLGRLGWIRVVRERVIRLVRDGGSKPGRTTEPNVLKEPKGISRSALARDIYLPGVGSRKN